MDAASPASAPEQPASPIVATTGSLAGSRFGFYETVIQACRRLGRSAVLVSPHRDHIPRDLPANVTYLEFAPFDELFRRASLVVHHGGIGTASYAIAAGIPQIVMPMRGDHFDNGNRLERLGVAMMLSSERTTPAQLARAIRKMLGSRRVAQCSEHLRARVDMEGGLNRAASSIESLGVPTAAAARP